MARKKLDPTWSQTHVFIKDKDAREFVSKFLNREIELRYFEIIDHQIKGVNIIDKSNNKWCSAELIQETDEYACYFLQSQNADDTLITALKRAGYMCIYWHKDTLHPAYITNDWNCEFMRPVLFAKSGDQDRNNMIEKMGDIHEQIRYCNKYHYRYSMTLFFDMHYYKSELDSTYNDLKFRYIAEYKELYGGVKKPKKKKGKIDEEDIIHPAIKANELF